MPSRVAPPTGIILHAPNHQLFPNDFVLPVLALRTIETLEHDTSAPAVAENPYSPQSCISQHSTRTMPPSALMPVPAGAAKEQFCKSTSAFLLSHATCTHASAFSHLKVIPVILTLEAFTTIAGTPSLLTEAPGSPVIRMGPCDCVMTTPPLTFPCVQYRSEIGGR
jgi:hypothetical protein